MEEEEEEEDAHLLNKVQQESDLFEVKRCCNSS